jgi:hypothetical protein
VLCSDLGQKSDEHLDAPASPIGAAARIGHSRPEGDDERVAAENARAICPQDAIGNDGAQPFASA